MQLLFRFLRGGGGDYKMIRNTSNVTGLHTQNFTDSLKVYINELLHQDKINLCYGTLTCITC